MVGCHLPGRGRTVRLGGSVLGEWGWKRVVSFLLYILFVSIWLGAGHVCSSVVLACVCGMGIWWGCVASMLLMWEGWGVSF